MDGTMEGTKPGRKEGRMHRWMDEWMESMNNWEGISRSFSKGSPLGQETVFHRILSSHLIEGKCLNPQGPNSRSKKIIKKDVERWEKEKKEQREGRKMKTMKKRKSNQTSPIPRKKDGVVERD